MESEKKFYINNDINDAGDPNVYHMVDLKSKDMAFPFGYYTKSKPCHLVLDSKTLIPMDDNSKRFGYRYNFKIVPDTKTRFRHLCFFIHEDRLIDENIYETIEENPNLKE